MREGLDLETPMVHSSCALLLSKLVAKVKGYRYRASTTCQQWSQLCVMDLYSS